MPIAASEPQLRTRTFLRQAERYIGSLGTPIKRNDSYAQEYQVPQKTDFKQARSKKAKEMQGCFVGPMPVQEFLDAYLVKANRSTPLLHDLFHGGVKDREEKHMYTEFIEKITQSGLIPGFKIVDTSNHPDLLSMEGRRYKPDPSMYRTSVNTKQRPTQFDELELNFEFKKKAGDDAFRDPGDENSIGDSVEGKVQERHQKNKIFAQTQDFQFESQTIAGKDARGQLVTYATEWFAHQHRLFGFTVFIFYPFARIIRWDRSAAVVTKRFDIRAQPGILAEFLWRFVHLSDIGRGRDPTVRKATAEETRLAKEHLSQWNRGSDYPAYAFKVPDSKLRADREFIGWGWLARPDTLIGRATRAYPVYERASGKRYFLKDSWRAVTLEKEAEILQELNAAAVRNVPRLVCGGDIDGHHTLSHIQGVEEDSEFYDPTTDLKRPWWKCGRSFIIERVHHRFVEDFIGKHLVCFTSSKQLLQVVYDAFVGHEDAFAKCGILHRDVSAKNVMMTLDGRGILNDWDLAKRVSASPSIQRPRTPFRTGTWQFISAMLLRYPSKPHVVQDDIESFVYIVLYHTFRYLQHTAVGRAQKIMDELFDSRFEFGDGTTEGGTHKFSFFNQPLLYVGSKFAFLESPPLQAWYRYAVPAVKQWQQYEMQFFEDEDDSSADNDDEDTIDGKDSQHGVPLEDLVFADHKRLREKWEKLLSRSDWPSKERIIDHTPDELTPTESKSKLVDPNKLQAQSLPAGSASSKRSHEEIPEGTGRPTKKGKASPSEPPPMSQRGRSTRRNKASYTHHSPVL